MKYCAKAATSASATHTGFMKRGQAVSDKSVSTPRKASVPSTTRSTQGDRVAPLKWPALPIKAQLAVSTSHALSSTTMNCAERGGSCQRGLAGAFGRNRAGVGPV